LAAVRVFRTAKANVEIKQELIRPT